MILQTQAIISHEMMAHVTGADVMRMTKEQMARDLAFKLMEMLEFQVREIALGTRIRCKVNIENATD